MNQTFFNFSLAFSLGICVFIPEARAQTHLLRDSTLIALDSSLEGILRLSNIKPRMRTDPPSPLGLKFGCDKETVTSRLVNSGFEKKYEDRDGNLFFSGGELGDESIIDAYVEFPEGQFGAIDFNIYSSNDFFGTYDLTKSNLVRRYGAPDDDSSEGHFVNGHQNEALWENDVEFDAHWWWNDTGNRLIYSITLDLKYDQNDRKPKLVLVYEADSLFWKNHNNKLKDY